MQCLGFGSFDTCTCILQSESVADCEERHRQAYRHGRRGRSWSRGRPESDPGSEYADGRPASRGRAKLLPGPSRLAGCGVVGLRAAGGATLFELAAHFDELLRERRGVHRVLGGPGEMHATVVGVGSHDPTDGPVCPRCSGDL